ncbi:hypothetical protein BDV30DRAFT_202409, partial [Aspergillus minisclerotigenes]
MLIHHLGEVRLGVQDVYLVKLATYVIGLCTSIAALPLPHGRYKPKYIYPFERPTMKSQIYRNVYTTNCC